MDMADDVADTEQECARLSAWKRKAQADIANIIRNYPLPIAVNDILSLLLKD